MDQFLAIALTVITAATPLFIAAIGELVVERSGVLNLGVEGMMIMGAVCGFGAAFFAAVLTGAGLGTGFTAGFSGTAAFGAAGLGAAAGEGVTGLAGVLAEAGDAAGLAGGTAGLTSGAGLAGTGIGSPFSHANTSSACPSGATLSQIFSILPSGPITNVLRATPM